MSAYDRFAPYYDAVYGDALDYDGDVRWLQQAFDRFGAGGAVSRVLDLGAGTGNHALRLVQAGFDVDGVDLSPGLLDIARQKAPQARFHIGGMSRDLPAGRWDAAICMFGAWCYLTDDEDARRLLRLLRDRLPPGGLFVFEFWTPYGWRPTPRWGSSTMPDARRIVRVADPAPGLPEDDVYRFRFEHFVLRGDALEERFEEDHALRLRTPFQTRRLLASEGFEVAAFTAGAVEGKSFDAPAPEAFRAMAIARRLPG